MTNDKSPIINLYPIDFELDMLYKHRYWQCIPILPDLEIHKIKKCVAKIKQDKTAENKNELRDNYVF